MFKSYEYIKYLPETNEYLYKIVDDDFEDQATADGAATTAGAAVAASIIKVYSKRNYSIDDIGLNLAFFCIHYIEKYKHWTLEELTKWQDEYIPQYNKDITHYKEIAKARDRHLPILYLYS